MYGIAIYVVAFVGFAIGWGTGLVTAALMVHRHRDEERI